jgi:hypothetical protein
MRSAREVQYEWCMQRHEHAEEIWRNVFAEALKYHGYSIGVAEITATEAAAAYLRWAEANDEAALKESP